MLFVLPLLPGRPSARADVMQTPSSDLSFGEPEPGRRRTAAMMCAHDVFVADDGTVSPIRHEDQRQAGSVFGERHLRTILAQYQAHYNGRRPHRSRQLHPPRPDHPVADLSQKRIQRWPILGGLINEYQRAA